MTSNQSYVYLKAVKPYKDAWRVQVKLLHSWTQNTSYGGETLECILEDETGVKIHASCKRNQMFHLQRNLPIGEWRYIENFSVSDSRGKYRPTPEAYKITFTSDTRITRSAFHDDNPFLTLAKYEDFGTVKTKANVLIDIIGEVFDLGAVQTVQVNQKDMKRVHFRMRDTNGRDVRCCLWGKYAELFESATEDRQDEILICLIRFAKISFYKGDLQITNAFDASVVTLNPTMKEAIDFRQKMLQNDLPLALIEKKNDKQVIKKNQDDWDAVQMRSIAEILGAIEVQSCKITCSIESIDTDWGWFYFGCNACNKRVTRIGRCDTGKLAQIENPLFRCEKCHSNVTKVSPKYKLHLFVKDDSDSCKLMMLDTVAGTIIGNEASELWDGSFDEIQDPEIIPMPIKSLVGKSFCFGLSITSGNLDNGSDTFFVSEVWTGDNQHRLESQSEPISALETNSSTLSSGEVMLLNPTSQNSSEGFSTPTLKRKEEDSDLKDITSTSKKLCIKSVKLEKAKVD